MLKHNQSGFTFIALLLVVFIFGMIYLGVQVLPDITTSSEMSESQIIEPDPAASGDEDIAIRETVRLMAEPGLTGSGTAIISQNGGQFAISISAVLPELEDDGYYEAYLDGFETQFIGNPTKQGATFKLQYNTTVNLLNYSKVKIVVDGPRELTNQVRPLPFDYLIGDLN